jgi:hypothetical protein
MREMSRAFFAEFEMSETGIGSNRAGAVALVTFLLPKHAFLGRLSTSYIKSSWNASERRLVLEA